MRLKFNRSCRLVRSPHSAHLQLVKITLPFPSLPSPVSAAGVGDLQVFDVFVFKASWGQWGLGPALVFPTASDDALGDGKWQAGPAVALMYTRIKNLMPAPCFRTRCPLPATRIGPASTRLIITPTLTYNLEDGWFAGLSDYDWEFDWKNGGDATFFWARRSAGCFTSATRRSAPQSKWEARWPNHRLRRVPVGSSGSSSPRFSRVTSSDAKLPIPHRTSSRRPIA